MNNKTIDVIIIGSGFAGAFAAYVIASAGLETLVIEKDEIASGASGNPTAHMIPYITSPSFIGHSLYEYGFKKTAEILTQLKNDSKLESVICTPTLQLPSNDRPNRIINGTLLSNDCQVLTPDEASKISNITLNHPCVLYNKTYTLHPVELCRNLLRSDGINVIKNSEVLRINMLNNSNSSESTVETESVKYNGKYTIIANAFDANIFEQTKNLQIKKVRGQVVSFIPDPILSSVDIPLAYNGYFIPSKDTYNNIALLGTTYDYQYLSPTPCIERNNKMMQTLKKWIPEIPEQELEVKNTRVAFRAVTHDRLPYAGKITDTLFISVGHGSRGLHSALVCAEYILSLIKNEFFNQKIIAAIDLNRVTKTTL